MGGAKNHKELRIWQLCDELRLAIMAATASGRVAMDRKFCDQLRGAAEDVTSDIAEGYARFYPREFARFLDYALSSLAEAGSRIEHGHARGYFSDEDTGRLLQTRAAAERGVRNLRKYLWSVRQRELPNVCSRPRPRGKGTPSRQRS
jgi:four helix bundle protein